MKATRITVADFSNTVCLVDAIGRNDRVWFPKWIRRYALCFPGNVSKNLPVTRSVVDFSKTLLRNGVPAWQRWQAVRAIEPYRNYVLKRTEPDLSDVIATLARLGRREHNVPLDDPPTADDLQKLRGNVNPNDPVSIQTMRTEMRVLHYAMATETVYVRWVERFAKHAGSYTTWLSLVSVKSASF